MNNKLERKNISPKIQLEVWNRDNWHCRYCGKPIFYAPALKLLDKLNPKHEYFHPNGKAGEILPLFQWSWASIDHVKPFSKGGEDSTDNYVSACWKCNLKYGEKPVGEGKPTPKEIVESDWDGFYGLYREIQRNLRQKPK